MAMLSPEEQFRYQRHFNLREVGLAGQEKIKQAKVLCVGAGGLGSAAIQYLTAAGIGTLGIVDPDIVEAHNLQRQTLYTTAAIGKPKVHVAQQWIAENNPHVNVHIYRQKLDSSNARDMIRLYDIVIDGTDNFTSRYVVNDACFLEKKPNVHASILGFEGQLSVFCAPGGACYRCLFPQMPPINSIPNCAEAGVLGVTPGVLGVLQATETLKWIVGCGELLINRLLQMDLLKMEFHMLDLNQDPACPLCSEDVHVQQVDAVASVTEITISQLRERIQQGKAPLLVDVREPHELEITPPIEHALNIPLQSVPENLDQFPRDTLFVVYCKSGYRSHAAATWLREQGFNSVNLLGGIDKWNSEQ